MDFCDDAQLERVITQYDNEANVSLGSTKGSVLKKLSESEIGELKCSEVTSDKLVSFSRSLSADRQPQTVGN